MTKSDIVWNIAVKNGLLTRDVKVVVDQLLEEIKSCLHRGDHLEIRGFGTFKTIERQARKARNPRTGEEIHVPARRAAVFKISSHLDDCLS